MKQKGNVTVPTIGGSALLVTFGVLCLVVLSLLSLNTALAEQRISESYVETTKEWYAADLQAQEIYAKLRAGEQVPEVTCEGNRYFYGVTVSEHQVLEVTLEQSGGSWKVITWRTAAYPEAGDEGLPVWKG